MKEPLANEQRLEHASVNMIRSPRIHPNKTDSEEESKKILEELKS